ncbi:hypothetical protein BDW02DRAFT_28442 [Decorospora gaudefroyi]|uniref:Uncharacterized protein n=1 Tax=Decorospora gaudefroyi TaxID=184978 RepID=A0A6A5K6A5_9PLEO|nr:hypothetical protein BDW02DRAFT_28442 [Decorospora gaudefroyi]
MLELALAATLITTLLLYACHQQRHINTAARRRTNRNRIVNGYCSATVGVQGLARRKKKMKKKKKEEMEGGKRTAESVCEEEGEGAEGVEEEAEGGFEQQGKRTTIPDPPRIYLEADAAAAERDAETIVSTLSFDPSSTLAPRTDPPTTRNGTSATASRIPVVVSERGGACVEEREEERTQQEKERQRVRRVVRFSEEVRMHSFGGREYVGRVVDPERVEDMKEDDVC